MTGNAPVTWTLTGGFRYIPGWFGNLVLQVEETRTYRIETFDRGNENFTKRRWRRANFDDLPAIRDLNPTQCVPEGARP